MQGLKKPLGVVIYDGSSLIDGQRVIAIVNGFKRSRNKKIGRMLQTWILRPDIDPIKAAKSGDDYSICGNCKHRTIRSCYVNLGHGPTHVFRAFKENKYIPFEPSMIEFFKNQYIRVGSYGDPSAIPYEIWNKFCQVASGFTGYTHNWKKCDKRLKKICMASVDNENEFFEAQALGWRTFRVRLNDESLLPGEFICPASKEAGKKIDCQKCRACKGTGSMLKSCPAIVFHGLLWKKIYYHRALGVDIKMQTV